MAEQEETLATEEEDIASIVEDRSRTCTKYYEFNDNASEDLSWEDGGPLPVTTTQASQDFQEASEEIEEFTEQLEAQVPPSHEKRTVEEAPPPPVVTVTRHEYAPRKYSHLEEERKKRDLYCATGGFIIMLILSVVLILIDIPRKEQAVSLHEAYDLEQICNGDSCPTEFANPDAPHEERHRSFPDPCRQKNGVPIGSIYYVHRSMSGEMKYAASMETLGELTHGKGAAFVNVCTCTVSPYTGHREQFCTPPLSGVVDADGVAPRFLLD